MLDQIRQKNNHNPEISSKIGIKRIERNPRSMILKTVIDIVYQFKIKTKWKLQKITPVYKAADKHSFINYRSVALFPEFSKIKTIQ